MNYCYDAFIFFLFFSFLASVYIHVHYIKIYFTIFRVKKSKKEKRNRETHMEYDNATFLAFFFFSCLELKCIHLHLLSLYGKYLNLLFRSCRCFSEELTCSIVHESKWTDYCDCCHFSTSYSLYGKEQRAHSPKYLLLI